MDTLVLAARVALSLAVVLGVLWFLQRRVSRSGRVKRAASAVSVVTRQGIAPKASVVVVDVEGTRYLLGVTEQSVTLLSSGEAPVAAVSIVPSAASEQDAVRPAPASADAFAQALHAESAATAADTRVAADTRDEESDSLPLRRPRDRAARSGAARAGAAAFPAASTPLAGSVLAGSILSGATWRQAGAALRQRRAG